MSMLDSFFSNKGFKGSKCKTLLKLTIPRIKLLRNRRELQIKQMRKDIAKLLETGQEATARIRVEHIIREENMMAAQEIIELFCELITVRLPIIESQRECPLDLKEAIASICFAAPRCADLPELLQVQLSFASKYGREFIAAATELMPDCGVNRQLVELLSVRAPSPEKKLKLLKEIAEEHELEWDPSPSESELFKSHEDLLNGPRQFISGSKVPLPKEKHDDISQSTSVQAANEYSDDEDGLDELDFPEVPKVPLRTNAEASTPQESAFQFQQPHIDPEDDLSKQESLNSSLNPGETKQFLPFISPPSLFSSASLPMKESEQSLPLPSRENEEPLPPPLKESEYSPHQLRESEQSPPPPLRESEQYPPPPLIESEHIPSPLRESIQSSPPLVKESSFTPPPPVRESSVSPPLPKNKSDTILDLNDVLAAAKAAAESAERAAAAARSAASLAEIRISELSRGRSGGIQSHESEVENPFHANNNDSFPGEHFGFDEQSNGLKHATSINETRLDSEYISSGDDSLKQELPFHQPQRIPSMEDDPEFSYPNLFSSHSGNMFSGSFSTNNSQPPR